MGQVTNKQIQIFRDIAGVILRHSTERDTKYYYAVSSVFKRTTSLMEDYLDDIENLKRDLAMVSGEGKEKGKLLRDSKGGYEYTKEDSSKLQKRLRELTNKKIEIKTHFVSSHEMPNDLTLEYTGADGNFYILSDFEVRSALEEFVIEPQQLIEDDD